MRIHNKAENTWILLVDLAIFLSIVACNFSVPGAATPVFNPPGILGSRSAENSTAVFRPTGTPVPGQKINSKPGQNPLPLIIRSPQKWLPDPSTFPFFNLPNQVPFEKTFVPKGWLPNDEGFGYLWETENSRMDLCLSYKAGESAAQIGFDIYQLSNDQKAGDAFSEHRNSVVSWFDRNSVDQSGQYEQLEQSQTNVGDESIIFIAGDKLCGTPDMSYVTLVFRRYNVVSYNFLTAPHLNRDQAKQILMVLARYVDSLIVAEAKSSNGVPEDIALSSRIAFISSRTGWNAVYSVNPDGSSIARHTGTSITVRSYGGLMEFKNVYEKSSLIYPAWSPDSHYIAFRMGNHNDTVGIVNVGGGWVDAFSWHIGISDDTCDATHLDPSSTYCERSENIALPFRPSWTLGGELMTSHIEAQTTGQLNSAGRFEFTVKNKIISQLSNLDPQKLAFYDDGLYDTPFDNRFIIQTLWSKDSSKVLFEIISESSNDSDIEIYPSDLSKPIGSIPTSYQPYLPTWSPDGHFVAFTSKKAGNPDIYVMNVATNVITSLTNDPASDLSPTWSPDGTQLAFCSNRAGNLEIYLLNFAEAFQNPEAKPPVDITNNPANDCYPSWSPGNVESFSNLDRP